MLTKEQMSILDKQYGQACADNNKLKTPWEGVRWAAEWGINSATSEIARLKAEKAELLDLFGEVMAKSPTGGQYPFWVDVRNRIGQTLKKHGRK